VAGGAADQCADAGAGQAAEQSASVLMIGRLATAACQHQNAGKQEEWESHVNTSLRCKPLPELLPPTAKSGGDYSEAAPAGQDRLMCRRLNNNSQRKPRRCRSGELLVSHIATGELTFFAGFYLTGGFTPA
jgi:hypothetical protein